MDTSVFPSRTMKKTESFTLALRGKAQNKQSLLTSVATKVDEGRFFTFTTQHGLRENTVNNIQEDEFGNLWLSGLGGIYRISRQELNEVAAGRRAQVDPIAYGEAVSSHLSITSRTSRLLPRWRCRTRPRPSSGTPTPRGEA